MVKLFIVVILFSLVCNEAPAQIEQVKRRAKDLSNQNNVRQGVPPPVQASKPAQAAPPRVAAVTTNAPSAQIVSVGKIQKDLAAIKAGAAPTDAQKQQLTTDITAAARGTKPSAATVKSFVDALAAVLPEGALTGEHQSRLAQNIEAAANSKPFSPVQYDAIIADVQATLEVAGIKRKTAETPAKNLKTLGDETRR